jgi:hypothetical protein
MFNLSSKKILACAAVLSLMLVSTAGGVLYERTYGKKAKPETATSKTESNAYSSRHLGFSLNYPSWVNDIQEQPNQVVFTIKDVQDMTGFGVSVEATSFTQTKDWLNAQPKGNESTAGYSPVIWMDDTLIVAEHIIVDYYGQTPIFGRRLWAITVGNGKMYKISIHGQYFMQETPRIDKETMSIITSFKTTAE